MRKFLIFFIILLLSTTVLAARPEWAADPKGKFKANKTRDSIEFEITNQDYIYETGYIYKNNQWEMFNFSEPRVANSPWIKSKATKKLLSNNFTKGKNYAVAYGCKKVWNGWDCNDNKWMLQEFTINDCVSGETKCTSENSFTTCIDNEWSELPSDPCSPGTTCQNGACTGIQTCSDGTKEGECSKEIFGQKCIISQLIQDPNCKIPRLGNIKDMSKYSEKEIFIVSNKNWKEVLPFISATIWTGNETCQKGYGTPDDVCVYPMLIYHEEDTVNELNISPKDFEFKISGDDDFLSQTITVNATTIKKNEIITVKNTIKNMGEDSAMIKKVRPRDNQLRLISSYYMEDYIYLKPGVEIEFQYNFTFQGYPSSFDADSLIYFLQQYSPNKITIIGDILQELSNLLTSKGEEIQSISTTNSVLYWKSYDDIVYVQNNYELALLASTYASLINAPLVIEDTTIDFAGKNIICIGETQPDEYKCNEEYNLETLQQKYIEKTQTNKLILVNPNDHDIAVSMDFYPEISSQKIHKTYTKNSLTAPILASAKKELIISTEHANYKQVDNFIDNKINSLQITPEYLTIIASPNAIEQSYAGTKVNYQDNYWSTDAWQYAQIDDDPLLDLAVGRIFGVTVTDTSSNIARSLFYDKTLKNPEEILMTRGSPFITSAAEIYAKGQLFENIGYNVTTTTSGTIAEDWKNKFYINYDDHGWHNWAGIYSPEIPNLDNSFVIAMACLTCDFKGATTKNNLFCSNIIRKGGIAYIGTTDEAGAIHHNGLIKEIFADSSSLGKAFLHTKNSVMFTDTFPYDSGDNEFNNEMMWYSLLGDPTLKLTLKHKMPQPQFNLIEQNNDIQKYKLTIPAIKFQIPNDVRAMCQASSQVKPIIFTTAFKRNIMNERCFEYSFENPFNKFPVAISAGWSIMNEKTQNKDKIWIKSPSNYNDGYFSTANETEFNNFEYDIDFYNKAPDIIVQNINLINNSLEFDITNIGDKDANFTIKYLVTLIHVCKTDTCIPKNYSTYNYNSLYSKKLYIQPENSEHFSIDYNEKLKKYNLSNYEALEIIINPEKEGIFVQQNYENDKASIIKKIE